MLWSTTDGTLWYRLIVERGWSDDRYAAWLGRMWVSMLVADHADSPGGRSTRNAGPTIRPPRS